MSEREREGKGEVAGERAQKFGVPPSWQLLSLSVTQQCSVNTVITHCAFHPKLVPPTSTTDQLVAVQFASAALGRILSFVHV